MWMNRYEIERAVVHFARDPVLGPAARFLRAFQEEVDKISDGWPYWSPPSKAASRLMALLNAHLFAGMGGYPNLPAASAADVRRCLTPIKAFMTRRGTAAGMKMPEVK